MTREDQIRRGFDRDMRLLEIGPSYNPIIPKADGWNTTVIDHVSRADLISKYEAMGVDRVDLIEQVDFVWKGERLDVLIPKTLHGTYDGLIASHVGEHLPDLVGFIRSVTNILNDNGIISLALPDKRGCFDFFQPLTVLGDVIAAYIEGRTRHQLRTFINQSAYFVNKGSKAGWSYEDNAEFELANSLAMVEDVIKNFNDSETSEYVDSHAWAFTPASFRLLIYELNLLGYIDWIVGGIDAAPGVEFYVWLKRGRIAVSPEYNNARRLEMLSETVIECHDSITLVNSSRLFGRSQAALEQPIVKLSIVAIIPLFNGARHLKQTLESVIAQTLPPDEVIVVDDGSTDEDQGIRIVEELSNSLSIKIIKTLNRGQSHARNVAVKHSSSDLIAFIDQDDVWYPNHLERLITPFLTSSTPALGWSYSEVDEIDDSGYLVCRSFLSSMPAKHPKRDVMSCIGQDMFILPSASLISRQAFELSGGFDERLCGYEDDDLFLRIFRLGFSNIFLDQPLSQWRIHAASSSYSPRMAASRNLYMRKLLDVFPDEKNRKRFFTRDLIVPRFFPQVLQDYEETLLNVDEINSAEVWDQLIILARHNAYIIPKIYEAVLQGYKISLQSGNLGRIYISWKRLEELVNLDKLFRMKTRMAVSLLRNSRVSKVIFALRKVAKPAIRWAFRL
jgi:glycosyltransferase involved in cell wall biosynthesis